MNFPVKRRRFEFGAVLVLALIWCLFGASAHAHWADLAVAEISTAPTQVHLTLTYPTGLTAYADDNRNGTLEPAEIVLHRPALIQLFASKIKVLSEDQPGALGLEPMLGEVKLPSSVSQRSHTTLALEYTFTRPLNHLKIRYDLFMPGVSTASCLATVLNQDQALSVVFTPEKREFALEGQGSSVDFVSFVLLGFEHILTGYDHLLFLLSLLALGGGLPYLLKVVTAFTVAHSVTLALTVLGVIALPGRVIESGIALSIAYVALENLLRRDRSAVERWRWVVTFVFGLLHGMGFADLLREMDLPRANLPGALVGFNLGVELGQLCVVIPVFVLLRWLERGRVGAPLRWGASAFAVAAGLFWFVERAFLTA